MWTGWKRPVGENFDILPLSDKPQPSIFPGRLGSSDRLMMSSFTPMLHEGGPDDVVFGAPVHDAWLDGHIRDANGVYYYIVRGERRANPERDMVTLWTTIPGKNIMGFEYPGAIVKSGVDLILDPKEGQQFKGEFTNITVNNKIVSWKEKELDGKDLLELQGTIVGPGIQMVFPTRRNGGAGFQTYYHRYYEVSGSVRGVPAKGFIFTEHNHDVVGWIDGTWASGRGGIVYFGNKFDDGTIETGVIYAGGGEEMRSAVIVNNKGEELLHTRDISARMTVDDNGFLTDSVYTLGDGSKWKYTWYPGNSLMRNPPDRPDRFRALTFGSFVKIGETRKRVDGWCLATAGWMQN